MTNEQKILLKGEILFVYMPFSFREAIEKHSAHVYSKDQLKSLGSMGAFWKFINPITWLNANDLKLTLIQEKDVKIANLSLVVSGVESAEVHYKNGIKKILLEKSIFRNLMVGNIEVDYDNPINKIQLNFFNDITDPVIVTVETLLYEEPPVDYRKIYLDKMNINHKTGIDLINIFFQLATEEIDETRIELFVKLNNKSQPMGVFKSPQNFSYCSITNLAPGNYEYNVSQFVKGKEIVKSDNIKFTITLGLSGFNRR